MAAEAEPRLTVRSWNTPACAPAAPSGACTSSQYVSCTNAPWTTVAGIAEPPGGVTVTLNASGVRPAIASPPGPVTFTCVMKRRGAVGSPTSW